MSRLLNKKYLTWRDFWSGQHYQKHLNGEFDALSSKDLQTNEANTNGSELPTEKVTFRALYQFTAVGSEQLSFNKGDIIICEDVNDQKFSHEGWIFGTIQNTNSSGWFPENYVEKAEEAPVSKLVRRKALRRPKTFAGADNKQKPNFAVRGLTSQTIKYGKEKAVAQREIITHDLIDVVDGPTVHRHLIDEDEENILHKNCKRGFASEIFPNHEHSLNWSNEPPRLNLSKRDRCIYEILDTEKTYSDSLQLVIEYFYKPLKKHTALSEDQFKIVFLNLDEILFSSQKLLRQLNVNRTNDEPIHLGIIMSNHFKSVRPLYEKFCANQSKSQMTVISLSASNPRLAQCAKKLRQQAEAKSIPIGSFHVLPVQRITRYKLLMENLLKYTPEDHSERKEIEDALRDSVELCENVDKAVEIQNNVDALSYINTHVICEEITETIKFNSLTNALVQRKLLYNGSLRKAKSRSLWGFLFNDLFLLTIPYWPQSEKPKMDFIVHNIGCKFSLYRKPILLTSIKMVTLTATDNYGFELAVANRDKPICLLVERPEERTQWVNLIRTAQQQQKSIMASLRKRQSLYSTGNKVNAVANVNLTILSVSHLKPLKQQGCCDPYCTVKVNENLIYRTTTRQNTLNPTWNNAVSFYIDSFNDDLEIEIMDHNLYSPDASLGKVATKFNELVRNNEGHTIEKFLRLHLPGSYIKIRCSVCRISNL